MMESNGRIENQYLTLMLGDELFGLGITNVREVLDMCKITKMPNMPGFVRGVINLRDRAVPVMDLHVKFGLPEIEHTINTRIVVIELPSDDGEIIFGILADSVQEVRDIEPEKVERAPSFGNRWRTQYIKGIGKSESGFIILLNIEQIMSEEETALLEDYAEHEAA